MNDVKYVDAVENISNYNNKDYIAHRVDTAVKVK